MENWLNQPLGALIQAEKAHLLALQPLPRQNWASPIVSLPQLPSPHHQYLIALDGEVHLTSTSPGTAWLDWLSGRLSRTLYTIVPTFFTLPIHISPIADPLWENEGEFLSLSLVGQFELDNPTLFYQKFLSGRGQFAPKNLLAPFVSFLQGFLAAHPPVLPFGPQNPPAEFQARLIAGMATAAAQWGLTLYTPLLFISLHRVSQTAVIQGDLLHQLRQVHLAQQLSPAVPTPPFPTSESIISEDLLRSILEDTTNLGQIGLSLTISWLIALAEEKEEYPAQPIHERILNGGVRRFNLWQFILLSALIGALVAQFFVEQPFNIALLVVAATLAIILVLSLWAYDRKIAEYLALEMDHDLTLFPTTLRVQVDNQFRQKIQETVHHFPKLLREIRLQHPTFSTPLLELEGQIENLEREIGKQAVGKAAYLTRIDIKPADIMQMLHYDSNLRRTLHQLEQKIMALHTAGGKATPPASQIEEIGQLFRAWHTQYIQRTTFLNSGP